MNHRTYLALAVPLIISTITTPLLGVVDTAVVGHLPDPAYIGGVAVGTIIFNTMYWLFGFLRVSTSGFAAQAEGAKNEIQAVLALARPFVIAAAMGIIFILFQEPIVRLSLTLMNPEAGVRTVAAEYFGIRVWGAPFTLVNYVILGWLMGMSRIKISLMLQVWMNLMNIALALLFVGVFSWGVAGVATATLISEITAFIAGLLMIRKASPFDFKRPTLKALFDPVSFKQMMTVNRDLFIRTVCLLTVFNLFTAKGASFGTEVLAANAVLIQIHYLMAYFFDGFSNASSILTGKAVGSKDERLYRKTLLLSCQWAVISSLFIAGIYYLCREPMIGLFTRLPTIIDLAGSYGMWLVLFPLAASFGIILYGVFTGATEAAPIRNSMIMALAVYLIVQFIAVPRLNNDGLWLAFIGFSAGRSVFLGLYIPRLNRKLFADSKSSIPVRTQ
ncbi:MATE family efflux transporter [Paenibacillus beijingensis]|uniref:Probable multidrug resistance protein NorM n=1 Tax=Paenibacillus beijingensis TaxID=1126833 RepID=A0A0D5NHI0_9BACL|nr:MATE family efflux transporter [Paenibacillus beijingensis]AJY74711.1 damage-inducible protein F [Paenibacillus beijingensis]